MRTRSFAALLAAPLLVSCMGADIPDSTAEGEARAAQLLAGRVAGAPVHCLPSYSNHNMHVIDRDTILFEVAGRIYRQDASGTCYPGGRQAGYALVTNDVATGGRLCAGEVARTVDTSSGMIGSSCQFNAFVPYGRP